MRFLFIAFSVLVVLTGKAHAQLGQSMLIDPKALSLGNAVTADPPGINSIHYNPAGLTKLDGRQISVSLLNVVLKSSASFDIPEGYGVDENGNETNELLDFRDDPVVGQDGEAIAGAYIPHVGIFPLHLPVLALPNGGISINPPGSKFTFATAAYMPMVAGFVKEGTDHPGRYQAKELALQRLTYLSPSFGYKVNDEFSVGASFLLSHQGFAIEQDARGVNILMAATELLQDAFGCAETGGGGNDPLVPFISLCGGRVGPYRDIGTLTMKLENSMSTSYNLGMLWEPTDWFAWGASYQSEAKDQLSGDFEMEYSREFAGFFSQFRSSIFGAIIGAMFQLPTGTPKETGYVTTEFTYPQHFQTGIKLRFFDRLQINVDAGWTDYDEWDYFYFEFDRQLDFLNAAKILAPGEVTGSTLKQFLNYESVWSYGFGLEYQLSSRLTARLGYEPRQTSIPDNRRNVMAPLGFAEMYGVGFGYRWDLDTEIDLSLSFLKSEEYIYADDPSGSLNQDCLTCIVANPYAGLDVKTELSVAAAGITFRTKF
ncbi:aromatic hydrocarbon degradation protein [Bermanella marisrubri]|uniref:Long-chain fatty acid transport protein n=1 Tax=Bermanella marisrubri TaxID=207949 RepID=Q1MXZ4_9GAMM|nr:outer membrane protein transport protein [Bermanella marisrubri]EAT10835.1 Long-chain fatty acid transport protein [Oceanobacter sp. RED65] [Bermanella marisrubri]QIZ84217.1 aromatic hydrocarbon degradation protein [Bermanella marisrubri]